jgi:hypothetical protein
VAAAPSASAFTFLNDGSVGINDSDLNSTFTVNFDGNVATQNVTGLTSEATFKFLGFTTIAGATRNSTKTEAAFEISLSNTTSAPLLSRTSALGFDVWNFDGTSLGSGLALQGIGNSSGSGDTRSIGLFVNDRSGSFPNQFGDVDVCFTNGNTCQGGTSGGVDNNPSTSNPQTDKFTATLAFSGSVSQFALNNFGVRYQSIDGNGFNGASGTGQGTAVIPSAPKPPGPRQIPEPGTVGALLLMGAGMLHTSRRKQQDGQQPQIDL